MGTENLMLILIIINGVCVPFILLGVRRLGQIRDHLALLNGRLGKVETWEMQHEKLDDERHGETSQKFERMNSYMRERK